jgi:hypothetical protein
VTRHDPAGSRGSGSAPRRRGVLALLPIALALALASLGEVGPTARAEGGDAVALAWRLEKGAALRYRYASTQETVRREPGGPESATITTRQDEVIEYRLVALETDAASGAATVLCRYDRVAVDLEQLMIGRLRWDSRRREDLARGDEPLVRPYARLVGREFGFKLAPSGEVSDLRGHDKVRAAVLEGLEDSPFAKLALGGVFGDEAVRGALERAFAVVPTAPAAPGARWTRAFEQPVPLLGTLAYEVDHELVEVRDGVARIRFAARIRRARPADPAEDPLAARLEVNLEGAEGAGEARFSVAGGRLERSEARFAMTVSSRLLPPVAPREGAGATEAASRVVQSVVVERIEEPPAAAPGGAK